MRESIILTKKKQQPTTSMAVELFLEENYLFRRNQLSGKVEYMKKDDEANGQFHPLTREAQNSIVIHAKREEICESGSPKSDIDEFVHSNEVPLFNPVTAFIDSLPQWDGQNHVSLLLNRLPGLSTEKAAFLSKWLRSMVAHWMQMDSLHGNEVVPTLIGKQGCGKTTFLRRLLPTELRQYFMDSINLSNRFDKEMALTNNLLVNLDELEAIRPSQQASLKQTLSVNKVNSRPIYGAAQEDKPRFASFTATTNNRHPLTDVTGSRRYICVEIPKNQPIDNSGEINYPQLYAQLKHELLEQNIPYWFTNDEVARIQEMNLDFMVQRDMNEMVDTCFRKPKVGETFQRLTSTKMLKLISDVYPSVKCNPETKVQLGYALKRLGYEKHLYNGRMAYEAIVKDAA